ncbi:MAG: hypothetical protein ACOYN0_18280, partial [Phycisphaerales bacterium]
MYKLLHALLMVLMLSPMVAGAQPIEVEIKGPDPEWKKQEWAGTAMSASVKLNGQSWWSLISSAGCDAAWTRTFPVRRDSLYRLSGEISTHDVVATTGKGALLNVHGLPGAQTRAITGTSDWTEVEIVFQSGERSKVQVNCLLGGWGLATGTAHFRRVKLTRLDPDKLGFKVEVHADRTRPPMHDFIYGQFIEHLGRCIYGGIWSEMLE